MMVSSLRKPTNTSAIGYEAAPDAWYLGVSLGSFSAAYLILLSVSFQEKFYVSACIVSRGGIESNQAKTC